MKADRGGDDGRGRREDNFTWPIVPDATDQSMQRSRYDYIDGFAVEP